MRVPLLMLVCSVAWADQGGGVALAVRFLPVAPVEGLPPASSVATSLWTSCAIAGGEAWCWGDLSIFDAGRDSPKPVRLRAPRGLTQLSLSETGACAVDDKSDVWCWGRGFGGRIPRKVLGAARQVSAGRRFACALRKDGKVACWGDNRSGQLGQEPGGAKRPPPKKPPRVGALESAVDGFKLGESGEPDELWPTESTQPLVVPELSDVVSVAAGNTHACAARENGDVVCWGDRNIERPPPPDLLAPLRDRDGKTTVIRTGERRRIPDVRDAVTVSAGDRSSCALLRGGGISCWADYYAKTPLWGPHQCVGLEGATSLSDHGWYAVLASGEVVRAKAEQCYQSKPERDVSDIVQAGSHCALRKDGVVVCWGSNSHGELARPPQPLLR
jgi:hypothetical protein